MRFDNKEKVLRIYLEGEVNSYNADNLSNEIDKITNEEKFEKLELDFSHVSYISSAGLRVVLKLKQKFKEVSVVEASLDIYDIFSMTGFASIMTVKKALRQIYVSGATIVGEGYYSTVYRLNDDTIVKVFNHVSDENQIERELALAKEAFMLGIPTAISYDIVKVGDKLGLIYGMGHAVYTKSDPRALILKKCAFKLAKGTQYENRFKLLENVEQMAKLVLSKKSNNKAICANVDLYSGSVYEMLKIPCDLYTPLFATARIAGWAAHRMEEILTGKRIIRPAYKPVTKKIKYIPMKER